MGHAVAWGERTEHTDLPRWRQRLVMAGSAAATLAVIVASAVFAELGRPTAPPPDDPRTVLTDLGRRALHELPLAYQADDAVVVPGATDSSQEWTGRVAPEWIQGHVLPLGARGLAEYERFSASRLAPEWTTELTSEDRVFSDVGPLWLACVRWPGGDRCSPALLMYHDLEYYFYATHLESAPFAVDSPRMDIFGFATVNGSELGQALVGRVEGTSVQSVRVGLLDGSSQDAWTSRQLAVPATTMWWTSVTQPVASVTAYDANGRTVARIFLDGSYW